jgi:dethiobiotin synthetase
VTIWLVTGTDTGVGKTVVTAAIAAAATAAGLRVAVLKPAQTGIAPEERVESDEAAVARLAAPASTRTVVTYTQPLAPLSAAEEAGAVPLAIGDVIEAVQLAAEGHDPVLVEGAGGLLVPMGEGRWTVADLAVALRCPVVVVARAALGTLNHTSLTLEALDRRGLSAALVIGAWPAEPELVHWRNLVDLPGDLVGVLPDGIGQWAPQRFRTAAPGWLSPRLYGSADPERLRRDGVSGPPPAWPEPTATQV